MHIGIHLLRGSESSSHTIPSPLKILSLEHRGNRLHCLCWACSRLGFFRLFFAVCFINFLILTEFFSFWSAGSLLSCFPAMLRMFCFPIISNNCNSTTSNNNLKGLLDRNVHICLLRLLTFWNQDCLFGTHSF